MRDRITVLIPSYNRAAALAVTLTGLCFQQFRDFSVVISDQSDSALVYQDSSVQTAVRLLEKKGHTVRQLSNLPRRGLAQQRQFLLESVTSPYCLYLDDDVLLEPFVLGNMLQALKEEQIGFVGQALIGMSFRDDYRPHEQGIELWDGPVEPEFVTPEGFGWQRYAL